jgi:hypothetical protein
LLFFKGIYVNQSNLDFKGFTNEQMENSLSVINTNIVTLNEMKISITQNENIDIVAEVNGMNCSNECILVKNFEQNNLIIVNFRIKTKLPLSGQLPVVFSSGSISRTVTISLNVKNRIPKLNIHPSSLDFTILRGDFKSFELTLINNGDIDAQKLNLILPVIQNGSLKLIDLQVNNSHVLNSSNFDLPLNVICKIFVKFSINQEIPLGKGFENLVILQDYLCTN